MNIQYCIVQAGGKGIRLKHLTRNRPKCLVPYRNLPILFHLFRQFPQKKFIVIGDYKYTALAEYLESFAGVQFLTIRASSTGTCSGIKKALELVPDKMPFMLVWSDLVLDQGLDVDNLDDANYAGISGGFECRWSLKDGVFSESPSREYGVAGFFIFRDKTLLKNIPEEGEFVRCLSQKVQSVRGGVIPVSLGRTHECGTLLDIPMPDANGSPRCRPFNKLEIDGDTITKTPVDDLGKKLAERECAWYREALRAGYKNIPEIISLNPLVMKRIKGNAIYRTNLADPLKKQVVDRIIDSLETLHGLGKIERDPFSIKDAYYTKTLNRLEKVRNLIPFADKKEICVNGRTCSNIYFHYADLREAVEKNLFCDSFSFIHGDCTFSNMMIDENLNVFFLDPRGYFGFTENFGDPAYDWAKVFYSIDGNYDQFNNYHFSLAVMDDEAALDIQSGGWEHLSEYFLEKIPYRGRINIKLIHAIIWFSLTSYAWEDYDSICGAFYKGLLLWDDYLRESRS